MILISNLILAAQSLLPHIENVLGRRNVIGHRKAVERLHEVRQIVNRKFPINFCSVLEALDEGGVFPQALSPLGIVLGQTRLIIVALGREKKLHISRYLVGVISTGLCWRPFFVWSAFI